MNRIWTLCILGGISSCAGNAVPGAASPRLESADLTLQVENRNFNDATIYAVIGGHRVRLGRVTGKTTESFTFRWETDQLQMRVDFTGGGRLTSDRLQVFPGRDDTLLLIISTGNSLWAGRKAG